MLKKGKKKQKTKGGGGGYAKIDDECGSCSLCKRKRLNMMHLLSFYFFCSIYIEGLLTG